MKSLGNCYNYENLELRRFEHENVLPSLTIPNMSMSVEQLLERYVAGGELMNAMGMVFDVPSWMNEEQALELYQRYDDNPDELTRYQELSNLVSAGQFKAAKEKAEQSAAVSVSTEKETGSAEEQPVSDK